MTQGLRLPMPASRRVAASARRCPICAPLAPLIVAAAVLTGPAAAHAAGRPPMQAPTVRIYASIAADGRVTLGDQPEPGAREIRVRTFASASDPQALATARRQQRYWREQSEAFAERLQERRAAEERERRARRDARSGLVVVVPEYRYHAAPWPLRPLPGRQPGAPASYTTSPGATAGAPAGFIGSGFATSSR